MYWISEEVDDSKEKELQMFWIQGINRLTFSSIEIQPQDDQGQNYNSTNATSEDTQD